MYHHVAHLDSFEPGVKVGMKFKRGDLLGRCGKTGTISPHCHYEVMKDKPKKWTGYVWGMSVQEVAKTYIDPKMYLTDELPMKWNAVGYGFLSPISEGQKRGYHPGIDLNWGSGSQDFGFAIRASTDGVVVYMGQNPKDGSWGNHLWWKEETSMPDLYDNCLIQETEQSGSFALVYGGKKHLVVADRAGLASLTVQARGMPYKSLTKAVWDSIESGDNF